MTAPFIIIFGVALSLSEFLSLLVAIGTISLAIATFVTIFYAWYRNRKLDRQDRQTVAIDIIEDKLNNLYIPAITWMYKMAAFSDNINEFWDILIKGYFLSGPLVKASIDGYFQSYNLAVEKKMSDEYSKKFVAAYVSLYDNTKVEYYGLVKEYFNLTGMKSLGTFNLPGIDAKLSRK